jgi:hypothetical protein
MTSDDAEVNKRPVGAVRLASIVDVSSMEDTSAVDLLLTALEEGRGI